MSTTKILSPTMPKLLDEWMNTMYYIAMFIFANIQSGEEGMDYEQGLAQLEQLLRGTTLENDFLTYEARLRENLRYDALYGTNEQRKSDRAQIIDQLNRLAANVGTSFNALCRPGNIPNFQTPPQPNYGSSPNQQGQPASSQSASQHTIAYISYHPRDQTHLDRLHIHLGQFVRKGMINYWDRTKMPLGADQHDEITRALESTKVAIILVSPEYLAAEPPDPIASYELPTLVPAAHKQKITLLSVIVRPCDFANSDLEPFHPVNPPNLPLSKLNPNKREEIWEQVTRQVLNLLR